MLMTVARCPQLVVLSILLVAAARCSLGAQDSGAVKRSGPAAAPYALEEHGTASAATAEREAELRAQIAEQPDSAELMYRLALVLRQEGNARASLDAYTQAARRRAPTAVELRSVALNYVILNDYDDAIHWLERAARMDPDNVDVLYSLGRCYYSKDRYLDAGRQYERVLAIQPSHLKAEENLGLVFDATNRPEQAEEALRKAAGWAVDEYTDEWPFLDLGSFLLDRDRAAEAIDPLRNAIRIRTDCSACHEKLGLALLATDDLPESIAELEVAAKLDPTDPKAHFELGRALRKAGQAERAKQEFAASQRLYSTHSQK